jgi:hypothetical protein
LVKEAEDDDEARTEAVEKVNSLKETLKHLKDQVMDEAEDEVQVKHKKKQIETSNHITQWVKQIAQKVPVISKLEKKLGMLQGLDPVLEGIVTDLDKVTDFSGMIQMTKPCDDDEIPLIETPSESTADIISSIKDQLESASVNRSEAKAAKKAAEEAESLEDLQKKYAKK